MCIHKSPGLQSCADFFSTLFHQYASAHVQQAALKFFFLLFFSGCTLHFLCFFTSFADFSYSISRVECHDKILKTFNSVVIFTMNLKFSLFFFSIKVFFFFCHSWRLFFFWIGKLKCRLKDQQSGRWEVKKLGKISSSKNHKTNNFFLPLWLAACEFKSIFLLFI